MSNILGQLCDCNDSLNSKIQVIEIISNDRLLSLSKMRSTVQEHKPISSRETKNASENTSEDVGKVTLENNKRDKNEKVEKNDEQDAAENNESDEKETVTK